MWRWRLHEVDIYTRSSKNRMLCSKHLYRANAQKKTTEQTQSSWSAVLFSLQGATDLRCPGIIYVFLTKEIEKNRSRKTGRSCVRLSWLAGQHQLPQQFEQTTNTPGVGFTRSSSWGIPDPVVAMRRRCLYYRMHYPTLEASMDLSASAGLGRGPSFDPSWSRGAMLNISY